MKSHYWPSLMIFEVPRKVPAGFRCHYLAQIWILILQIRGSIDGTHYLEDERVWRVAADNHLGSYTPRSPP